MRVWSDPSRQLFLSWFKDDSSWQVVAKAQMFAQLLWCRRDCTLALQGQKIRHARLIYYYSIFTTGISLAIGLSGTALWKTEPLRRFPLRRDRLHQINVRCPLSQGCWLVPIAPVWREGWYYELIFTNMSPVRRKDKDACGKTAGGGEK